MHRSREFVAFQTTTSSADHQDKLRNNRYPAAAHSHLPVRGVFCHIILNIGFFVYFCGNMKLIELNIDKIIALCQKYRVAKLWVFGSILTPRFNDSSDVDFSVDFDSDAIKQEGRDWADTFFDFMHELEAVIGRKVDLVCDDSVKNPYFRKQLNSTKKLIYG